MLQFAGKRTRGKYFSDRATYLAGHVPNGVKGWLCHSAQAARGTLDQPSWTTLVLGSGCLEALDAEDRAAMTGLARGVVAHLDKHPEADGWFEGDADGALRRFVGGLVGDRVDPKYHSDVAATPLVSDEAADLVLVAALVTRLYHRMKASEVTALTRSGEELATMDRRSVWWPALEATLVKPAVAIADKLRDTLGEDGVSNLVRNVLDAVTGTIDPAGNESCRVALWHLALLTECAWHFLTRHTSVYPGWSDLLLTLALQDAPLQPADLTLAVRDGLVKLRSGMPRPAYEYQGLAATAVSGVFEEKTQHSWERGQTDDPASERSSLYGACAALLNAQASEAASAQQNLRPPVASAFVTTFDLELEMALLRAAASPFLVAVPFRVLVGTLDEPADLKSYPAWIAYVVRPDVDGLEGLLDPTEWIVLRDGLFGGVKSIPPERGGQAAVVAHDNTRLRYGNLPVVVRLSGSPLVRPLSLYDESTSSWKGHLKDLREILGKEFSPPAEPSGNPSDPGVVLEHAVVIDEYAAMQQTAAELFMPSNRARVGLPTELVANKDSRARFWMLLGVQVSDPGMRHRVAFQMSAPALTGIPRVGSPSHPGIVVNRRLTSEDQELLYWFGFDVVHGRCQDFVEDLQRVATHHKERRWHRLNEQCTDR